MAARTRTPAPVTLHVTINQRDLDRVNKQLDKWQGKPLAQRLDKAIAAAAKLFVVGLRSHTPARTGQLRASVKASKVRKRRGEVAAYAIWPLKRVPERQGTALLAAILSYGAPSRGIEADPFIDRAFDQMDAGLTQYISTQVSRLV